MKDTASFVFLAISLYYYIVKYRVAYFDRRVSALIVGESILLLIAISIFSFVALYSPVSKVSLSSLVIVVFGLFFDSIRERYPGRGLVASTTTIVFLLADGINDSNTPITVITSIYIALYVGLLVLKARDKTDYTPVFESKPLSDDISKFF